MQLVISLVLNPDLPTRPQEDEVQHKAAMEERERQHRAEWEVAIAEKQRLAVMRDEEADFRKSIMDRRATEFQALRVSLAAAVCFRAHLQRLALCGIGIKVPTCVQIPLLSASLFPLASHPLPLHVGISTCMAFETQFSPDPCHARCPPQAAREERIEEKKQMLKEQREFNRKKEFARQCRVKVRFRYSPYPTYCLPPHAH